MRKLTVSLEDWHNYEDLQLQKKLSCKEILEKLCDKSLFELREYCVTQIVSGHPLNYNYYYQLQSDCICEIVRRDIYI